MNTNPNEWMMKSDPYWKSDNKEMPLSTMQKESTVTILDKPVTCVINFSTGCMAIL